MTAFSFQSCELTYKSKPEKTLLIMASFSSSSKKEAKLCFQGKPVELKINR